VITQAAAVLRARLFIIRGHPPVPSVADAPGLSFSSPGPAEGNGADPRPVSPDRTTNHR
jgi:hypothetical protein